MPLEDRPGEDLLSALEPACQLILGSPANVLVHCAHGTSRSAALCIAFVMRSREVKLREAVAVVKRARSAARPNEGFVSQLVDYEERAYGRTSMARPAGSGEAMRRDKEKVAAERAHKRGKNKKKGSALQYAVSQGASQVVASSRSCRIL